MIQKGSEASTQSSATSIKVSMPLLMLVLIKFIPCTEDIFPDPLDEAVIGFLYQWLRVGYRHS